MVKETSCIHGPFVVIVSHQIDRDETIYPMVISLDGGFPDKEVAKKYIQEFEESMKKHGEAPDFDWYVAQLSSLSSFKNFCSF